LRSHAALNRASFWQLDYFTEGSIPDALIGVPQGWTPDQIKQFQDCPLPNSPPACGGGKGGGFAGDLAKRRRAKFVPGERAAKVVQTKEPQHKDDFDEWLARIICFAFSVPPQWATKAMNRATADNQSAQAEEEGLEPTKEWVKDLIDEIVADEFASPDLELHWLDEDEGDPETVLEGRLKVGALTLNEMRDALGLDPFDNAAADRPMVLTATGFVPIEANAGGEGASAGAKADSSPVIKTFDPNQRRVAAGNPDGGQWTKEEGGASDTSTSPANVAPSPQLLPSITRYASLDTGVQTDASNGGASFPVEIPTSADSGTSRPDDRYSALTVHRYDRTGDPLIDKTTDILFQTLVRDAVLMDRAQVLLGKAGPALYGTMVHFAFATDVRWQDLPGIGRDGVEQSFSAEDVVQYGANGSIRTDVVMRDADGHIIAVWDVKTGNAELTDARRQEIREEAGESRSRKSAQDDKWSFCLTAGRLWPANQERP
jgi:hypothetical protein